MGPSGPDDVRVALLDIEGTTTPVAFVHDTLFTYARQHLGAWLAEHAGSPNALEVERTLAAEYQLDRSRAAGLDDPIHVLPAWDTSTPAAARQSVSAYARWLMDRDRKSPGLKQLQGLIWEAGYQAGTLRGVVFDDVPRALRRWHEAGIRTAIFSSGSVLAQRRLFESTSQGDLTPFVAAYFDTAVGAKIDRASYERIVSAIGCTPREMLFVSDVTTELRAARAAGLATRLAVRPGNARQPDADEFERVTSFDEILPAAKGGSG